MAEVLNEQTTRVALKGKKFEVRNPASDQDVVTTKDSVITKVDKTILKGKYQAKSLSSCKEFQTFLKSHCRLRTYTFQIRKCDDRKCWSPIKNPSGVITMVTRSNPFNLIKLLERPQKKITQAPWYNQQQRLQKYCRQT